METFGLPDNPPPGPWVKWGTTPDVTEPPLEVAVDRLKELLRFDVSSLPMLAREACVSIMALRARVEALEGQLRREQRVGKPRA